MDTVDFIKTKNICLVGDPLERMKRQAVDREEVFAKHISDKGFLSRSYKELSKLNIKKSN